MRQKQKGALLLAGVMIVGSVGIMNPATADAAQTESTFTLTVPADTNITGSGWNDIGNVTVSGEITSSQKVTVTITDAGLEKTEKYLTKTGLTGEALDTQKVKYELKTGNSTANDVITSSGISFSAADVKVEGGKSQAIGAEVDAASYNAAENGVYEDTISFTAAIEKNITANSITLEECTETGCTNTTKVTLADLSDLGTETYFTYNKKEYYAYNDFIPSTNKVCWHKAVAFVDALNKAYPQTDGSEYMLLDSQGMANAWWNASGKQTVFGNVGTIWTGKSGGDTLYTFANQAYYFRTYDGSWDKNGKTLPKGFVIVRGPMGTVDYDMIAVTKDNKDVTEKTLSSANLGTASAEFEVTEDNTTKSYVAYPDFISHTSGSSWQNAADFINALNAAKYQGYDNWQLLSSADMADAWWKSSGSTASFGDVNSLWSSVESEGNNYRYQMTISSTDNSYNWSGVSMKDYEKNFGFVVARCTKTVSEVTVTKDNTEVTEKVLSSANLGEPSEAFTYDEKSYVAYPDFVSHTSGSSWQNAVDFVKELNAAKYQGYDNWQLLSSYEQAKAWWDCDKEKVNKNRGDVEYLWTSLENENNSKEAYVLYMPGDYCTVDTKTEYSKQSGFVIIRESN